MAEKEDRPDDAFYSIIARIIADAIRNMPEQREPHIIGYTIISQGLPPMIFRVGRKNEDDWLPYEMIESDEYIYITAVIPPGAKDVPKVEIWPETVRVEIDERRASIILNHPVDVISSGYRVQHGILDIILKRAKNMESSRSHTPTPSPPPQGH